MRFITALFLFTTVSIFAISPLKSGDLLFVSSGKSEFSDAISISTASEDSLKFVHVAMVLENSDSICKIIEASPSHGVRIIDLNEFLAECPLINNKPGIIAKRLITEFSVDSVIARAKSHLGEPYDWWYLPDNNKMYCSELIYESFIDDDGHHIFQSQPMNFRDKDGNMPDFWQNLFEGLGEPIPEGLPGTNPSDLSKSLNLIEVYRFF